MQRFIIYIILLRKLTFGIFKMFIIIKIMWNSYVNLFNNITNEFIQSYIHKYFYSVQYYEQTSSRFRVFGNRVFRVFSAFLIAFLRVFTIRVFAFKRERTSFLEKRKNARLKRAFRVFASDRVFRRYVPSLRQLQTRVFYSEKRKNARFSKTRV